MMLTFRHSQPSRLSQHPEPDEGEVDRLAREAATYSGRGDHARALRCFELALLMDECRADLWYQYGTAQERAGRTAEALETFEFAMQMDPSLYGARYRVACLCCEAGRPLEALSQFRQVTELRPAFAPAWRHLAELTWALGGADEAERLAREGLAHSPGDPQLQALLPRIARERGSAR